MKSIKGKFEVKSTPASTDDNIKKMGGMAMIFDKKFFGALEASSQVSMFGIMNSELGSGSYIALELVNATIEGKTGTFVMQHSCFMNRGKDEQLIKIVPDSGSGDLKGISGNMKIEIVEKQHYYHLDYSL